MRSMPDVAAEQDYISKNADLRKAAILIVDADRDALVFMTSICRNLRFGAIFSASDTTEAFKILGREKLDILICDCGIRPLRCVEFVKRLRLSAENPNSAVPVVVLASKGGADAVAEARDAGVDDFIIRPLVMRRLLNAFISLLSTPRTFVRSGSYTGPCRRRRNITLTQPERRLAKDEVPR
ncbi:MAG: response regulator [Alphaproteobacteria bacterium]|nr:response regulator [Alphaproteobacteria bacterium]